MRNRPIRELESERVIKQLEKREDHDWILLEHIARRSTKPLDEARIRTIIDHIQNGGMCKPIVVVRISRSSYCINGDGRHRYEAHKRAGLPEIFCRIANTG